MNKLLEIIIEKYCVDDLLILDGFDDAIIGIDPKSLRLIYSMDKCINLLMKNMSEEEALEFFYYNVYDAYVGEKTPIFCDKIL